MKPFDKKVLNRDKSIDTDGTKILNNKGAANSKFGVIDYSITG